MKVTKYIPLVNLLLENLIECFPGDQYLLDKFLTSFPLISKTEMFTNCPIGVSKGIFTSGLNGFGYAS